MRCQENISILKELFYPLSQVINDKLLEEHTLSQPTNDKLSNEHPLSQFYQQ
jgi:hypothetical protein